MCQRQGEYKVNIFKQDMIPCFAEMSLNDSRVWLYSKNLFCVGRVLLMHNSSSTLSEIRFSCVNILSSDVAVFKILPGVGLGKIWKETHEKLKLCIRLAGHLWLFSPKTAVYWLAVLFTWCQPFKNRKSCLFKLCIACWASVWAIRVHFVIKKPSFSLQWTLIKLKGWSQI